MEPRLGSEALLASYLSSLSEACAQQREEDSRDGDVISWLSKTCDFSTGIYRHAPWNITNRHLVTLRNNNTNSRESYTEKLHHNLLF